MDTKNIENVLQFLNEKYAFLERLQGQETVLKDIVRAEIVAIETTLLTLVVEFERRSCCKCHEPEIVAKDDAGRNICRDCMS